MPCQERREESRVPFVLRVCRVPSEGEIEKSKDMVSFGVGRSVIKNLCRISLSELGSGG